MHISRAPLWNCKNPDSYGQICVNCDKCGRISQPSRVAKYAGKVPKFKVGLNENYYYFCTDKAPLVAICESIGKAPGSIYFNDRLGCWAVRIKTKRHKAAAEKYNEGKEVELG